MKGKDVALLANADHRTVTLRVGTDADFNAVVQDCLKVALQAAEKPVESLFDFSPLVCPTTPLCHFKEGDTIGKRDAEGVTVTTQRICINCARRRDITHHEYPPKGY